MHSSYPGFQDKWSLDPNVNGKHHQHTVLEMFWLCGKLRKMWLRRRGVVVVIATRFRLGGGAACRPHLTVAVILVCEVVATRTTTSCVEVPSSTVATAEATATTVAIQSVSGEPR